MTAALFNLLIAAGLARAAVFPEPQTPFQVTWESVGLVDSDRPDPFNEIHRRRLMISKFAPVPISACLEGCRVPYTSDAVATVQDDQLEEGLETLSGGVAIWPRGLFSEVELELCCEVRKGRDGDAEETFPTVLFGPGLSASRIDYSGMAQHIAGIGYNVIVMDYPYDANIVEFPDGTIIRGVTLGLDEYPFVVDVRVADASFVLDTLGFTDADTVIHIGHSFGGASSAAAVAADARIAGGANMDGAMYGPVVSEGVGRPFLVLGTATAHGYPDAIEEWREFINATRSQASWVRELYLEGALHWSLGDWALLGDVNGLRDDEAVFTFAFGEILRSRVVEILREYLSDFVEFALGNKGEDC